MRREHGNSVDYSQQYFFIEDASGAANQFLLNKIGSQAVTLSYSTNLSTWTTVTAGTSYSFAANTRVYFKGTNTTFAQNDSIYNMFAMVGAYNIGGNIMSLINETSFRTLKSLSANYTFAHLFDESNNKHNLKSAQNLYLPATTLTTNCYAWMFKNCTSLLIAPSELPATSLQSNCYYGMFYGCTSLQTIPAKLPATALSSGCYYSMFESCTTIKTAPVMPVATGAASCCQRMFYGCTALTTPPPELFTSSVSGTSACVEMFRGCTRLTTAPSLPATTLSNYCYSNMFRESGLREAPNLPATTLKKQCYNAMFRDCVGITRAPKLVAKTLVSGCYNYMWTGCAELTSIIALFTTTPSTKYTQSWVEGVQSYPPQLGGSTPGTFTKSKDATWNVSGANGIPAKWNVVLA